MFSGRSNKIISFLKYLQSRERPFLDMVITNDDQRIFGIYQEQFLSSINVQREHITMINVCLVTLNGQVIYLLQEIILFSRYLDTVCNRKQPCTLSDSS